MTGPTKKTRLLVLIRDQWLCQVCGRNLASAYLTGDYSLQHRRARGMGGSRRPDTNAASNLLTVCGSATTGCHGWIEANPIPAGLRGWRIGQTQTPASEPVLTYTHGWVLLDDNGGTTPTSPRTPPESRTDPPTGVRMGQTSPTRQKATYCRCGDPECPISMELENR